MIEAGGVEPGVEWRPARPGSSWPGPPWRPTGHVRARRRARNARSERDVQGVEHPGQVRRSGARRRRAGAHPTPS